MSKSHSSRTTLKYLYQISSKSSPSPSSGLSHFLFNQSKTPQNPNVSSLLKNPKTTHFSTLSRVYQNPNVSSRISQNPNVSTFLNGTKTTHFSTFSRISQNPNVSSRICQNPNVSTFSRISQNPNVSSRICQNPNVLKSPKTAHFSTFSRVSNVSTFSRIAQKPNVASLSRINKNSNVKFSTFSRFFETQAEKLKGKPNDVAKRVMGLKRNDLVNKVSGSFAANVAKKPVEAVKGTFSRYKGAVGLQIEAFWKRNYLLVVGAGGVFVCILLWRVLFGIANTFVGLSEGMAKYGFLALSTAIVAFAGLYLRSRYIINPDKVYRMAMTKLNTSAGILEVMGAPLSGTDLRAYVMSGGGITLKNFKPRFRGKRCFLIFPIRGSERKGLVSVEVKNRKGRYDMKLLAVDIPMASGPDQRLFLIGNEEEYQVGGGLISELRDPVVRAMAATKEFEDRDDQDDEEDDLMELEEAERKHEEEVQKLERERESR